MNVIWILILTSTHLYLVTSELLQDEIFEKILHQYDKRVAPQSAQDEKNQVLTTSGWFEVAWKDHRIGWNKSEYNLENVVVPSSDLWLPDIGFLNSASIYHPSMSRNEFRCVVYRDGSILWVPGGTYRTTCELDISNFPFDKQQCHIHLTNWAYNVNEMNLTMSSSSINMESYKRSAEWKITETEVTREEVVYACCGNVSYPALYFRMRIQRKSLYYIINIILPCILLAILANFAFCVPSNCGEKISLGITLLLSFTVFQLIVADSIPRRSDSIPTLSLYIIHISAVVTASVICTIFVSHLHHKGKEPMPNFLRVLTFDILAKITCLGRLKKVHGSSALLLTKRQSSRSEMLNLKSKSDAKFELLNMSPPHTERLLPNVGSDNNSSQQEALYCSKMLHRIDEKMERIAEALSQHESRRIDQEHADAIKNEWYAAGKVFDRFFFITYILIMIGLTVRFVIPGTR